MDAVTYLAKNRDRLKIDPLRTIISGGSAGGHLASLAVILNDLASLFFRGMVLFNPVLDTSPQGYGFEILEQDYKRLSPIEHLDKIPPTLIMHGKADKTVPYSNSEEFAKKAQEHCCDCTLVSYENCDHGFFNQEPYCSLTLRAMENWLHLKFGIQFEC